MDLETFIVTIYCEVDDFIQKEYPARKLRERGPLPRLADSEVITMEIVGEYLGLNTEKAIYQYFSMHWKGFFPQLPDRSNFVRQCANLWAVKKALFEKLQRPFISRLQIVDSMPLEVCRFVRARRSRLFRGVAAYGKWFGQTIYGFKLHLKISRIGLVRSFDLTGANTHDLTVLPQLLESDRSSCRHAPQLRPNQAASPASRPLRTFSVRSVFSVVPSSAGGKARQINPRILLKSREGSSAEFVGNHGRTLRV